MERWISAWADQVIKKPWAGAARTVRSLFNANSIFRAVFYWNGMAQVLRTGTANIGDKLTLGSPAHHHVRD
jgi:hypothetical protein